MIYAKDGILVDNDRQKIFKLFKGKVINNEKSELMYLNLIRLILISKILPQTLLQYQRYKK